MTRKDYIFIAACVASAKDVIGRDAVLHLARHFAAEFSRENSQFDENRFLNNVRKESGQ